MPAPHGCVRRRVSSPRQRFGSWRTPGQGGPHRTAAGRSGRLTRVTGRRQSPIAGGWRCGSSRSNAIQATWQHSRDTSAVWAGKLQGSVDANDVAPDAIEWLLLEQTGVSLGRRHVGLPDQRTRTWSGDTSSCRASSRRRFTSSIPSRSRATRSWWCSSAEVRPSPAILVV